MLDERKATILRAIVEEYIETAQPVGSAHVARAPGINVSAATIRNDMAALEQEGYLHQPHTSAGRVPTEKGYRFFVDSLGGPGRLTPAEAQQVRQFFARAHGELEAMLESTSRLLSKLTRYTAVVVGPAHEAAVVRSAQLVSLTPRVALFVVVLSSGAIEKHAIEFDDDVDEVVVNAAGVRLAGLLVGRPLAEAANVVLDEHDPGREVPVMRATLEALRAPAVEDQEVYIGGTSQMAEAFDAVASVREILRLLEQQFVVVSLLRDVLDRGLQVAIGTETGMEPLSEAAVVVAPYEVHGEPVGSIGVLGPARMNYPQAMAAVAVVSARLGRTLSEG